MVGYFVKLQGKVLFASFDKAVEVTDRKASVIEFDNDNDEFNQTDVYQTFSFGRTGLGLSLSFQTAIAIKDTFLVIGYSSSGVKLYKFNEDKTVL